MKVILFASLFMVSVLSNSFLSLPNEGEPKVNGGLVDYAFGLYIGSNLNAHIPSLPQCLLQASGALTQINNTYNQIVDGLNTQNPNEIGGAIVALAQFLNESIVECGDAYLNGSTVIAALISDLKNITFFELAIERIGQNLPQVIQDIQDSYDALFKTGDYFTAGKTFGDVIRIFFDIQGAQQQLVNLMALGAVNWPFQNCGSANDDIGVSSVDLDSQPAKGSPAGINIGGSVNKDVKLKQVQIVTLLYGVPLNTQYDANTNAYSSGDPFKYRFAVSIPSYAPSGSYKVQMTFQDGNSKSHGCVQVAFSL